MGESEAMAYTDEEIKKAVRNWADEHIYQDKRCFHIGLRTFTPQEIGVRTFTPQELAEEVEQETEHGKWIAEFLNDVCSRKSPEPWSPPVGIERLVGRYLDSWGNTGVDEAIEEIRKALRIWAAQHPDPDSPFLNAGTGHSFSARGIVAEIEKDSEVGKDFLELILIGVKRAGLDSIIERFTRKPKQSPPPEPLPPGC